MNTVGRSSIRQKARKNLRVSAVAFVLLVGMILSVWWIILRDESHHIRHDTAITADQAVLRLEAFFASHVAAVEHFGQESRELLGVPGHQAFRGQAFRVQAFRAHALDMQKQFPGFRVINWVDVEGVIRWVVPEEGNSGSKGLNLRKRSYSAKALEKAERTGVPQMTDTIDLVQGGKGFEVYYPVKRSGRILGTLGFVFSIVPLVEQSISKDLVGNYFFQVAERDKVLHTHGSVPVDHAYAASRNFSVLDREWTLTLFPTEARIASDTWELGGAVVALGLLLSGVLCGLLFLYRSWQAALLDREETARVFAQKKQSAEKVKTAQSRLMDALGSISAGIDLFDVEDRLVFSSAGSPRLDPHLPNLFVPGVTFESIVRTSIERGYIPEIKEHPEEWIQERLEQHRSKKGSTELLNKDGRWIELSDYGTHDGGTLVIRTDITARKRVEEKIEAALAEKEVLIKEIHHRVKNNFQVIASLLDLQAGREKTKEAADALKVSRTRIIGMAKAYEHLYRSEDLAHVDARDYLRSIVNDIRSGTTGGYENISIDVDVDHVSLDGEQAYSCGQIISELITNAFKYAFPENRPGVIDISLHRGDGGMLELTVADNGVGFAEDFDLAKTETLGLKLVSIFANKLGGHLILDDQGEKRFHITFPEKAAAR